MIVYHVCVSFVCGVFFFFFWMLFSLLCCVIRCVCIEGWVVLNCRSCLHVIECVSLSDMNYSPLSFPICILIG